MSENTDINKTLLFGEDEDFLEYAEKIANKSNNCCDSWQLEYQTLFDKYKKLLRQSNKLVKISDHTQKKLYLANEEINEKVIELTEAEKKLQIMADTDLLTKLANRRGTYKRIEEEISQVNQSGVPFTLLLIDIDHFKRVNDRLGHKAGDLVLQQIAVIMQKSLRTQDILGRWGGEEFIIILPRTELNGAKILSEKIRETIEKSPVIYKESTVHLTISIGGILHHPGTDIEMNLDLADKAMYKCKKSGRNRVEFYEDELLSPPNKELYKEGILLNYQGPLRQEKLEELIEIVKRNAKKKFDTVAMNKCIFLLVEMTQNIIRYSSSTIIGDDEVESSLGIILLGRQDNLNYIKTSNRVDQVHKKILEESLKELEGSNEKELNILFQKQMHGDIHEESKGAGLGLIEIYRKADNVEYSFTKDETDKDFFTLKAEYSG